MRAVLAIALKDLKQLVRDKANAFFTFVFPVLLAMFFGLLFGGGGGQRPLELVVVDDSKTPQSAAFIKDLDDDAILQATTISDRVEAESRVRNGDALACIVLSKDFAVAADGMFSGGGIQLEAIVDPGRKAESSLLVGKLNEIAFKQLGRSFDNPEQMKRMLDSARQSVDASKDLGLIDKTLYKGLFESVERLSSNRGRATGDSAAAGGALGGAAGWSPAKVTLTELASTKDGPPSTYAVTFPQGIAWVLMSCVTAFSSSLARERARGTMLRLAVAPISRGQVLCGKALGCFITCAIGISILIAVARLFFGVSLGNPLMLLVAIAASAASGAGVMMVISGVFRTEAAAEGAGRAVVLVLAMIGGGTIPLFFMPPFMLLVSSLSPFKWAIKSVEGAMWRGFTVYEMAMPIGILLGLTGAGAIAGWIASRRAEA